MSKYIIQAVNFNAGYKDKIILSGLNLTLSEGEWIEIQAINNSGKTTLLNSIYGCMEFCSGQLMVLDYSLIPLNKLDKSSLRRKIGYSSQINNLLLNKTLRANLAMALHSADRIVNQNFDEIIATLLDKLGIYSFLKYEIKHLSYSNQILASIARAVVHKPKLVLLDQSLDHFDIGSRNKLIDLLQKLIESDRLTVLSTSITGFASEISGSKSLKLVEGQFVTL